MAGDQPNNDHVTHHLVSWPPEKYGVILHVTHYSSRPTFFASHVHFRNSVDDLALIMTIPPVPATETTERNVYAGRVTAAVMNRTLLARDVMREM